MELIVDVTTFDVLAAIVWANVVVEWWDYVCRDDVEELSHHDEVEVFALATHAQHFICWHAMR